MPQVTIFPLRNGLTVQRGENLQAVEVLSEGGLDLTQSILEDKPGCASALVNFEVSLTGGYRRINGFAKYSSTIVPGQGIVLGVAVFQTGSIIAARQDASDATKYNIYSGTGTSWTKLNPAAQSFTGDTTNTSPIIINISVNTNTLAVGQAISGTGIPASAVIGSIDSATQITMRSNATATNAGVTLTVTNPLNYTTGMIINNSFHNWTGTYVMDFTDGVNPAYEWNGTTFKILNKTGSAADPHFSTEFAGYYIVGAYSSNTGAIKISAPHDATDWATVDGAAEIVVGDNITGLMPWRAQLIIFCKNSIYKLVGNSTDPTSSMPFILQQVTDRVGCLDGRTIQELSGDLVFLAQDGIRTISGTANIGDSEIASISRPIQYIVASVNPSTNPCHSVVIKRKTQYRLFYPSASANEISCYGIIGGIRRYRDGKEGWEWGQLMGIKPSCAASGYFADNTEYIVHGGYDGYVYRQEQGNMFGTNTINEIYKTVPFELGDRGIRKVVHRVTIYAIVEGASPQIYLRVIYDLNKAYIVQPGSYLLTNIGDSVVAWDDGSLWDAGGIVLWDTSGNPVYRQNVQGSGFIVQLQVNAIATNNSPYIIQGYHIEYYPAGRR